MALPQLKLTSKLAAVGAIILALALAAAGIYWVAYSKGSNRADVEIVEYEKKVSDLNAALVEKQSAITNEVVREYHTRTIERERVVYQNAPVIAEVVPEGENLAEGWVYAHNKLVNGELIEPEQASSTTPSETSSREALQVIAVNYDLARANADRLRGLQDWVRQQEEASEETTVD